MRTIKNTLILCSFFSISLQGMHTTLEEMAEHGCWKTNKDGSTRKCDQEEKKEYTAEMQQHIDIKPNETVTLNTNRMPSTYCHEKAKHLSISPTHFASLIHAPKTLLHLARKGCREEIYVNDVFGPSRAGYGSCTPDDLRQYLHTLSAMTGLQPRDVVEVTPEYHRIPNEFFRRMRYGVPGTIPPHIMANFIAKKSKTNNTLQ